MSAFTKIDRAMNHYSEYMDLSIAFLKSRPDTGVDTQSPEIRRPDVWREINCIVGDVIHNLRSALDHLAYAYALRYNSDRTEKELRVIAFTIAQDQGEFDEKLARGKVRQRMGQDWVTFLGSVQPFTDANYIDLVRLERFDNMDKHRLLLDVDPLSKVSLGFLDGRVETDIVDLGTGPAFDAESNAFLLSAHFLCFNERGTGEPLAIDTELLRFSSTISRVMCEAKRQLFSEPAEKTQLFPPVN